MSNSIVQWNCRGFRANFEELSLLTKEYKPVAICLQETFLRETDRCSFKNYSCYYTSSGNAERACGGTALLINSAVPHMPLSLNTNLQATAASLSLNKKITLCSLYLPPSIPIDVADQGLRLALGAFRTSPINSLYAEANEPSLNLRRKKLSMQYYLKLKSNPENPTHKVVFDPLYRDDFQKKNNVIPPFSMRCEADVDLLDFDLEDVAIHKIPDVPLWASKSPTFLYNLTVNKKATTDPLIFKSQFLEIQEKYCLYEQIYTDGSKDGKKVAAAAVLDGESYQFRLPNNASIFSAELKAIDLALNHINQDAYWRYIIFTDSLSAMQAIEHERTDNPLIVNLLEKTSRICTNADLVFCWLPSHIGISGNEEADIAAKEALSLDILPFQVPFYDFKPMICDFIKNIWQQSWNDPINQNNKLFTVKPTLGEWLPGLRTDRREEIILARLHIGHTYLTHSYLLKGEEEPQCIPCNACLTVKHIFVDCVDVAPSRDKFFNVDSMTTLFETVKLESIFEFLKEVNLYKKI